MTLLCSSSNHGCQRTVPKTNGGDVTTRTVVTPMVHASPSVVHRVSKAIRRSIVRGQLLLGVLLRLKYLTPDLGVSPSPVGEAPQRFASQGLVVLRLALCWGAAWSESARLGHARAYGIDVDQYSQPVEVLGVIQSQ
jgi:Bacterial regulatory proteins, gntR family